MAALAHLGIGLAAKRVAPHVHVTVLVLLAYAIDVVWALFYAAGLDHLPGPGLVSPWSHSLAMAAGWSLIAALAGLRRGGRRLAAIVGALVFSHWIVDFVTQPMTHAFPGSSGPTLAFEGPPGIGIGLYRTALAQNAIEYGALVAGVLIWLAARRARAPRPGDG
jgi:membrane-bound metal-dependent hydrolase YbcI (DUF457 family)